MVTSACSTAAAPEGGEHPLPPPRKEGRGGPTSKAALLNASRNGVINQALVSFSSRVQPLLIICFLPPPPPVRSVHRFLAMKSMVVKTRRQGCREPSASDRERSSQAPAAPASGKAAGRRAGREGKTAPAPGSLAPGRGRLLLSVPARIGSRLGLTVPAFLKMGSALVLAAVAGILHWYHISNLFENDRHFSHLSTLEKEMAFRTEMVVLASWYRIYTGTMDFFGFPTKICWTVNRGEGLNPVESCEGLGDPAYFYVTFVFVLNGVMMSLFFIYGTYLSGSRLGGVVTVLCFFFNHGESTRVMWTPPLRESFSYPFLVLQMLLLTHILRTPKPGKKSFVALGVSNVLFMLPWQFAQFVLLTQIASLFASYIMGYLVSSKLQSLLLTHMVSLLACFVLMFGNSMLLTSFYASSLVSIWGVVALKKEISQYCKPGIATWVAEGLGWFISTVILKSLASAVLGAADDAHISSLIKSKFTSYKDFDTMMYTCAAEFDFMEKETPLRYIKTLLFPVNLLVFAVITGNTVKQVWKFLGQQKTERPETMNLQSADQTAQIPNGEMVYHLLQLIAFTVLAILIMRLKLFLTPHMCIMASLICSRQLFSWAGQKYRHQLLVFGILSIMAVQGVANLQSQWSIMGEFSNLPQEELLEWIKANSRSNAVFAGAMPTMASVKLSAMRPVVNHPHYEDAGLRQRTKLVYAMYSRKPAEEVRANLVKLGVDYFILEDSWCTRRSRPGCSMPEIWDVEDPRNAGKIPLCTLLGRDSRPHFITVFQNNIYKVLKVSKTTKDR
ncbi:dpy-19-like 1, like isoform X2 [Lepisosteus oculatus]|uniref:dpy-19-like 1, like isoform X2 n=1 Tax=Lepisosteus oculatus TaxID=7918 RepID=UPI0035F50B71